MSRPPQPCKSRISGRVLAVALAAAVAAPGLGACGMADGAGDGPPYCTLSLTFPDPTPTAPATVTVYADLQEFQTFGPSTYQWQVTHAGEPVAHQELGGDEIRFEAAAPGVYRVRVQGSVGALGCAGDSADLNVRAPDAFEATYRLRILPAAGQPAPIQERLVTIPGGAGSYSLGTLALDPGVAVSGTVTDELGQALPGYLRFTSTATSVPTPTPIEAFADAGGAFAVRLAAGAHDLLVVPDDDRRAPARVPVTATNVLGISVPAAVSLSGQVLGPEGDPVPGARVSLRVDGVPSSVALTGASGGFTLGARLPGAVTVTVLPPKDSGLPRLELGAEAGLALTAAAPITVRYAATGTARDLALETRTSDGQSPAGAARLTFVARPIAAAGTVSVDGSSFQARGLARIVATAGADGVVPLLRLPEALYDVVVEPGAGAAASEAAIVRALDLRPGVGAPAELALGQGQTVTGRVVDGGGATLAGVRVHAVPVGILASSTGAAASTSTGADGGFTLRLAAGGEYELRFDDASGNAARAVRSVEVPAAEGELDLGPTALVPAVRVTGTVTIPGVAGGAPGAHLTLLCADCTGARAALPLAEAVTGPGGGFVLRVPDPGTAMD